MKSIVKIALFSGVSLVLASCFNKREPNYQFMPNMYESVGYETYQESPAFKGDMQAQLPAEGSVRRGWLPYEYPDTTEGYEKAKSQLNNPLASDVASLEKNIQEGKALYDIYCAVCHGAKGNGQGILAEREKFAGVPNYKDREITQGSIYHVMYYGLNSMGSYASQINEKERWQVALYVEQLRNDLMK
ncbi:c-type cytochrome [Capnocytophaga canimorsus]|uniref:Cytochrome c-553 n=2 Tax=Capnocytophaga canimorsus TaxID=28188 RepID=F9YT88_CAPCC|nr:cytochrome c [Capnocytophaga canimorsus]AEK24007.1 Cytochrome c-553 [Capnocytophaga canimorsus Cc5]ATA77011.1 cytochrome C [Capnocytophaga canimorsus]PJI83854.1 mono/diheme cytochrome c family protein [Capnocytophaga canimorsus]WGU68569.1 cytochrome c [Capnocytophaga canimorsus]WGU70323.1 cytochrome c [Capnocytophaga canimorsus]